MIAPLDHFCHHPHQRSVKHQRSKFSSVFLALPLLYAGTASYAAEEPTLGGAKARPKTETAMKLAPVPAFPIPTAAADLPTKKFKLPPGFKVETWASAVLGARDLRQTSRASSGLNS